MKWLAENERHEGREEGGEADDDITLDPRIGLRHNDRRTIFQTNCADQSYPILT